MHPLREGRQVPKNHLVDPQRADRRARHLPASRLPARAQVAPRRLRPDAGGRELGAEAVMPEVKHTSGLDLRLVMPGLVPGIHVLKLRVDAKTWMARANPARTRRV